MASRVELTHNLDAVIAARFARAAVNHYTDRVADTARRRAPAAKTWATARDANVRPSHVETDEQTIPENLRYQLPKMTYLRGAGWTITTGVDLARYPRDPNLPTEQSINCRCNSHTVPGVIAASIETSHVEVSGSHVHAEVSTRFPRIAESEFGTSGDTGTHFMRDSIVEVAASSPRR